VLVTDDGSGYEKFRAHADRGCTVKDERGNVPRQLLIGLGALLATALVIGGTVSVVALGAANLAGVTDAGSSPSEEPSLYRPTTAAASTQPPEPVAPEQPGEPTTSATPESEPVEPPTSDKPEPKKQRDTQGEISLSASPQSASTYENIYLTGTYRSGDGTTLQVQRFEGGWVDFPASASVRGGSFETYVASGQEGENRFRVVDQSTGQASEPVSVILR